MKVADDFGRPSDVRSDTCDLCSLTDTRDLHAATECKHVKFANLRFFVSQYFMWFVALLIVPNDSRCLRLTCLFCFGHFAPQAARCLSSSSKWWFGTASGRHARVSVWQNGRKLCTENDLRLANKRRMPQPSG